MTLIILMIPDIFDAVWYILFHTPYPCAAILVGYAIGLPHILNRFVDRVTQFYKDNPL